MPMLMQKAIAKMIQKPCEANAGLEIGISVFEPRSLPALAHYHPLSDSPERLGLSRHSPWLAVALAKAAWRRRKVFALSDLSALTSDLRPLTSVLWLRSSPLPVCRSDGLTVASSLLPRSKLWSQSPVKV